MDNFENYEDVSELNTNNVSVTCLKKKIINEDSKSFSGLRLNFNNSLHNSLDDTKHDISSYCSYNESRDEGAFQESHSPTYISKDYEPLSSSAEDGEDSVNSFIDIKSSEFSKRLLETGSCIMNTDNIKKEDQEAEIDILRHELTRPSTSSPSTAILNKSVKRKSAEEHDDDDENGSKRSQNIIKKFITHSREKYLKLETSLSDDFKKDIADIKIEEEFCDMPSHSQNVHSDLESHEKSPSFQSMINLSSRNVLNNLEEKPTVDFSEQLLERNQIRLIQSPERNPISSPDCNKSEVAASPPSSPGTETPYRLSIDTDDMIPIQAEVVMSDASESEQPTDKNENTSDGATDQVRKEVEEYLTTFVNGTENGNLVEYPPVNNEVPKDCSDLAMWQLENVSLPPFKPFLDPPSWIRLTIPPEGYKCNSCGDIFFIESSLVQHKERRSVWITFDCSSCDAKLTFYNKCAFKCHIESHVQNGENVEGDSVVVRTLPLQLMKLLQPIVVPVPKSLRPGKTNRKLALAKSPSKLSSLYEQSSGKENHPESENPETVSLDSAADISPQRSGLSTPFNSALTSKKTFKCYLCETMFYSVRDLMSHMRTNQSSSDQRVECRKCLLVLPSVCAAKAHILTHPPANSCNISVCPECGSRCDGPRDFVHHLNTCGHQYRRSGILCQHCKVSFFKFRDDFISHWIKEHCSKTYECVVCSNIFESLVFHKCSSPGKQVFATFKCLLTCPLCPHVVQLHTQEERETQEKIRAHLNESHASAINRVYYVYKSKFCTNAFRSKDELRAHHDREHRRDNHYRTKTCTLHHEVLGFQHQYFNGQEPRNAFISLSVALSQEEMEEAQTMDVPTVSSVVDTTLFPHRPMTLETLKILKGKESPEKSPTKSLSISSPSKKNLELVENLRPCICYRCGYTYTSNKDIRRHKKSCEGESSERVCQICGVAAVGEEFSLHCKVHIDEGLILCMYCNGAPFPSSQILLRHFELHANEQFSYPVQCPFCSYIMSDTTAALTHMQEEHECISSTDSLSVKCDRCQRMFHGERGLSVHLTWCNAGIVSPNKNVNSVTNASISGTSSATKQCLICKKGLSPEIYGKHIISHLEEGLLVCSLCDCLPFHSSVSLLHHLEEHSSNLQFPSSCPVCSYTMSSSQDALTHLKEDHGFGSLTCSSCEMHYNFTYQLQRHIDIVHKVCLYAKRRYICWICRAYDHVKKETLINHFRNIHGLAKEQVDEKVMIRTRGQGTMPTSQFIPTKPLGSKKLGGNKSSYKSKKKKSKSKLNSSKLENDSKPSTEAISKLNVQNVVIKKEVLDIIQNASNDISFDPLGNLDHVKVKSEPDDFDVTSEVKQSDSKSINIPPAETQKASPPKILIKINNKNLPKIRDTKLRDRTKVMIKRLPDSALRSKNSEKSHKASKDNKLRKKKKAFNCNRCSYGTNYNEKFEYHKSKHENNGTDGFLCSVCGQSFVVEPSLKRHMFFAHKIKQKPQTTCKIPREYTVEISNGVNNISNNGTKKKKSKNSKNRQIKTAGISRNTRKGNLLTNPDNRQRITIKIKSTPVKVKEEDAKEEREAEVKKEEEDDEDLCDNLQCSVCKEVFLSSVQLYSHLRTHGMAFLKHGRKKRHFVQDKTVIQC